MVRLHTVVCALTSVTACGQGPSAPRAAPREPPPAPIAAPVIVDAAVPDAAEPPRLACEPGAAPTIARAPALTWQCAHPDGTRDGAFVVAFPDGTPEITGTYRDDLLDGAWQRRSPSGAVIETGSYAAGLKSGHWQMTSEAGAVLGDYEMRAGTGVEKYWLDDGALYSERALKAGVPHGAERIYAVDGTPMISAQWTAGKLDGPHAFGTRTTMRIEETFAAGVRRGSRQIWQAGALVLDESYDRNGKLHGAFTIWRGRKIKRAQGEYVHGKRDGLWTWNDRDGNKERSGNYLAGRRDGPWTEWFENKIVFSGNYTGGRPDGEFIYYDRNQNEIGRFTIRNGTGTMLTFWPNRKIASRQQMRRGKLEGVYQEITNRGKVVVEGAFLDDVRHGAWKEWTPDGVPTLEQTWNRGRLDGPVRKYVDGQVSTEATYHDGQATGAYAEYRGGKPAVTGQLVDDIRTGTWTFRDAEGRVTLTATYQDGVLEGPWQQLIDGGVVQGTMTQGRRTGAWTLTDRAGAVRRLTTPGTVGASR